MALVEWLRKAWTIWKRVGQFIGDIIGRIVLSLLYFTVVLPFGVGVRLFSDPLRIKATESASFWHQRPEFRDSFEEALRQ